MSEGTTAAFARLAAAFTAPTDAAALAAAVTDDVRIERHGPGTRDAPGPIAERFAGAAAAAAWLQRSPARAVFTIVGEARPLGDARAEIDYAIDVGEDFHNTGVWIADLAPDGRIAVLAHQPFALPPEL